MMRARALLLTEPTREMTRSRRGMRMAKMPAGERTWVFKAAQDWKGPAHSRKFSECPSQGRQSSQET